MARRKSFVFKVVSGNNNNVSIDRLRTDMLNFETYINTTYPDIRVHLLEKNYDDKRPKNAK